MSTLLKSVAPFNKFPAEDLKTIESKLNKLELKKDDVICREKEAQDRIFILEKGSIRRVRNGILVDRLSEPGRVSGLLHAFDNEPIFATLIADEDKTIVWVLPVDDFNAILGFKSHQGAAPELISYLARIIRQQSKTIRFQETGADDRFSIVFYDTKQYVIDYFTKENTKRDAAHNPAKPQDQSNKKKDKLDETPRTPPLDNRSGKLDVQDLQQQQQQTDIIETGEFRMRFIPQRLDRFTVSAAAGFKCVCVFVNDSLDKDVVSALARLGVELIACRSAGFDHVDLDACKAHDITVVRVPAYSPNAVAEHAVGLMMTLNRKFHRAYARTRDGNFSLDGLMGFVMAGKTVGVIGTGKIGLCVVKILLCGFGCNVLCYDVFKSKEIEQLAEERKRQPGASWVKYVDTIEQVMSESDIITIHVPLMKETRHLVNRECVEKMKPGCMVINTSRGELIDTDALIDGLKSGKIGCAGLDVYEREKKYFFSDFSGQVIEDSRLATLIQLPNVIVTSHQAFFTHEAVQAITETTLDNVRQYACGKRGKELANIVEPTPKK